MKKTTKTLAAVVLAITMAFTGCSNKTSSVSSDTASSTANSDVSGAGSKSESSAISVASEAESELGSGIWENAQYTEDAELGEGAHTVKLEVKAGDKSVTLTVKSDNDNLEKILIENKLVEGDDSEFGLYIKKVIGIHADYDADGAYWALCKDGETTATGASGITIADGDHYEFVYTPANGSAA